MRVLLVNAHGADLAHGGAERYVCEIAQGLERRGHEANVLSSFPVQHDPLDGRTVVLHATDWRDDNRRRLANHLGDVVANPGRRLQEAVAATLSDVGYTVQIAGAGRLRGLVEAAAARGEVRYVGRVQGEAKHRFLESTDLAILPSIWEEPGAPPYSVAEWLAARRPILVSNRGGLGELRSCFFGVVTAEPSPEGLVAAARRLAEPSVWDELVRSIPPPDDAAVAKWLDQHEAVYELARPRPPAGGRARPPT